LFTQCSKCETIFKLSAAVLRTAGGQVRCGRCGEVFNALARLAEQPGAFAVGESPLELEARADRILESPTEPEQATVEDLGNPLPPGVELARLDVADWPTEEGTDPSLEFTLPPGELDRIFVANKSLPAVPLAVGPHPTDADVSPPAEAAVFGLEISESAQRALLAARAEELAARAEEEEPPDDIPRIDLSSPAAPQRPRAVWIAAAVLLALLLAVQVIHQNRAWLVANTALAGALRTVYAKLGRPLPVPADLSAYQLRQWGVTGDPDASGALHVRASILNTAANFQPYPLLRVTLADRFGHSVGTREFAAPEYLGKPATGLLAPGERAEATIKIQDPGKDAEGFEIDVCLAADHRIACANDAATHAQ
jgi:predicted Zn finger-like uncharacterized protein